MNTVSKGLEIDFISTQYQETIPPDIHMSGEMEQVCENEVTSLLLKGAVTETSDTDGFFSALFVIPKKSGGFRPIVNLKGLNSFVCYEHFKMERLDSVKFLLKKGDWLVKLDLKDAYLLVPILPNHQKFLRFRWKRRHFQFRCLPFGLSSAPRVFTKIMKVVVAYLRERGIRLIIYLDDILIMCHSLIEAQQHRDLVIRLLESLGFIVNLEKSVLNPSQIMEYLGMVVNSINMSLSLPDLKVSYITTLCQVLFKPKVSLREIFSLLGNLSWAIPSIPFAQMHYRDIQNCHIRQLHWANKNFQKEIVLSEDARKDLSWWILNLKSVNGKSFFPDALELEI